MKRSNCSRFCRFSLVLSVLFFISFNTVFSQSQKINLEIELGPALENAQVLSLTSLGINKNGAGPVWISGSLENLTDQQLEDLYFDIEVSSAQHGVIVKLTQKNNNPFSLAPFQSTYATNNDLANSLIPGLKEEIYFTGGFTTEGDNFVNSLEGSTTLPADLYTISVSVFQVNNENGRQTLSTATAELGKGKIFEASEIYLKTPGDVVGAGAEISSLYPQFSWEGEPGATYRLLVVKANSQDSPESLLQSAQSSPSTQEGGSLLQFENLDVLVERDSYQYPASGAQSLEMGQQYYWKVITTLKTGNGTEERSSEIWSFTLTGGTASAAVRVPMSESVNEALTQLLGNSEFSRLIEEGYALEGIEMEGRVLNGIAAAQLLEEILRKVRDGEIILAND